MGIEGIGVVLQEKVSGRGSRIFINRNLLSQIFKYGNIIGHPISHGEVYIIIIIKIGRAYGARFHIYAIIICSPENPGAVVFKDADIVIRTIRHG